MALPAPKCSHCDGWGYEPRVVPMANCTKCRGAGRPGPASLGQLEERANG